MRPQVQLVSELTLFWQLQFCWWGGDNNIDEKERRKQRALWFDFILLLCSHPSFMVRKPSHSIPMLCDAHTRTLGCTWKEREANSSSLPLQRWERSNRWECGQGATYVLLNEIKIPDNDTQCCLWSPVRQTELLELCTDLSYLQPCWKPMPCLMTRLTMRHNAFFNFYWLILLRLGRFLLWGRWEKYWSI